MQRRLAPRPAWHYERGPSRARIATRDRIDRQERRRLPPPVLELGEHRIVDRVDRHHEAVRGGGWLDHRLPPGRLPVSAVEAGQCRDVQEERLAAAKTRR